MITRADLPIPDDVQPTRRWPSALVELADHIGPKAALTLAEAQGGNEFYIPADPKAENVRRLVELVGEAKARIVCQVYTRERLVLPLSKAASLDARREPVIADIVAGKLTITEGARRLGTTRSYLSRLVGNGRPFLEGPAPQPALRRARQMDFFD